MRTKLQTYLMVLMIATLASCTESSQNENPAESSDEAHRARSWSAVLELNLKIDTSVAPQSKIKVLSYQCSESINLAVEQMFDDAFTGEAQVHPVNLFGDINHERKLSPEELVDELQQIDSVQIENINTGAMQDTIIDMSFKKNSVSAVVMKLAWDGSSNEMSIPVVALGKQVFNEETGAFRGVRNRFYLMNHQPEQNEAEGKFVDRLYVLTDSLGSFYPAYLEYYKEGGEQCFKDRLLELGDVSSTYKMTLNMQLESATGSLFVKDVKLEVVPKEAEA